MMMDCIIDDLSCHMTKCVLAPFPGIILNNKYGNQKIYDILYESRVIVEWWLKNIRVFRTLPPYSTSIDEIEEKILGFVGN